MVPGTAAFRSALDDALPERPFRVVLWDGSELPPTDDNGGPTFTARSPEALAHVLRAPGQLGLGRAYVSGALDVDDLDAVVAGRRHLAAARDRPPHEGQAGARRAARDRAGPPARGRRRPSSSPSGRFHSLARDSRAVRHHYDVPPEFFRLFLGPTMTYSCAIFSRGASDLEEAQEAKLELVCQKLGLERGQRVLDVGCGWGSFAIHAAQRHGVHVTGITLSPPQVETAQRRAEEAGVADRTRLPRRRLPRARRRVVRRRRLDRDGRARRRRADGRVRAAPARRAAAGRAAAQPRHRQPAPGGPAARRLLRRYVFPDGAPQPLSRVLLALERAGLETHHIEDFRDDYAETLRHWAQRLDEHLEEAVRLAGAERVRVWRLYLRAARNGFETGFTSIYQVRAS